MPSQLLDAPLVLCDLWGSSVSFVVCLGPLRGYSCVVVLLCALSGVWRVLCDLVAALPHCCWKCICVGARPPYLIPCPLLCVVTGASVNIPF
jgi:hypothetical protein